SRFVTTAYFTTNGWLDKNKAVARRFADAIFAAGTWAQANPDKAGPVLAKAMGAAEARPTQRYATKNDPAELQALARAAVQYKLAAPLRMEDLVWNGR
ncbi:MAG TPA: hypothetical protein VGL62_00720, partial [Vicinamibacterales bacterium]